MKRQQHWALNLLWEVCGETAQGTSVTLRLNLGP